MKCVYMYIALKTSHKIEQAFSGWKTSLRIDETSIDLTFLPN